MHELHLGRKLVEKWGCGAGGTALLNGAWLTPPPTFPTQPFFMSMRRSSRIKRLELDETVRQRVLVEPSTQVTRQGGPYGRIGPAKAVDRLLRHDAQALRTAVNVDVREESPLRGVFGKLTGKIQEVMKGIFPFKLFSSQVMAREEAVEPLIESLSESRERLSKSQSRDFEAPQSVPDSPGILPNNTSLNFCRTGRSG